MRSGLDQLKRSSHSRVPFTFIPRILFSSRVGFPVSGSPFPSFLIYSLFINKHNLYQLSENWRTRGNLFHILHIWNCPYSTLTVSLAANRIIDCKLASFAIFFSGNISPPSGFILFYFFICGGFCHTSKWNSHGFTCVPHPNPPSHLPLHPLPLGFPSAPGPSTCLMHPTWAGDLFHPR